MAPTSVHHLLLASLALLGCSNGASAAVTSSKICSSPEFAAISPIALGSSPVTIKSLIVDDQVCLEFALTASVASSAGWFAVGLSTSDNMVSSPRKTAMLFQKSVGSPESYVVGGQSRSQVTKESDQSAFVVGSASTSAMSFSYQRTLAAASTTELAIAAGAQVNFIWAYGSSWPISSHRSGTYGTATYTFGSASTASSSSATTTTTTTAPSTTAAPATATTSSTASKPFCDGKNCTAIVGGIAFLVMVLAGLMVTVVLHKSPIGRALLHRTLAAPPLKSTTNSVVGNPWTLFLQNIADLRVGELFMILLFAAAVVLLATLSINETKTVVSGQVVCLFLMFILLPVSRVRLWTIFFGSSFERIIKFHRWLGMAMTIAVIIHLVDALKLTTATQSEKYGEVTPLYGFIAFVSFIGMALLANEYLRRKAFELFYITHRVLSIVGLVFSILHAPKVVPAALVVPLVFYGIGLLTHWCVAYMTSYQANVSVHHSSGATSLVLQANDKTGQFAMKMNPGSYFWVKIPTLSHTQWHPFSAIVTPDGSSVGFCIKAMGEKSYTRTLLEEAQKKHAVSVNLSIPEGKMAIDVDLYDVVILIAGGVGITPMLSLINQKRLFPSSNETSSSVKSPDWFVVWSVHEANHLLMVEDFMPTHAQLDYAANARSSIQDPNVPMIGGNGVRNSINVNWNFHVSVAQSEGAVARANGDILHYKAGRPVLDEFVNSSRFIKRRVAVLACGPPTMCVEAQALARQCGFDFHKEVFNW